MRDLTEPGYTVRLLLRGQVEADESFVYWADRLPEIGQLIEVSSEYCRETIEAHVTRITPNDDVQIHALETGA